MAVNIRTIKDIRNYLSDELHDMYPDNEINAMSNIIILKLCNIKKINQLIEPQYAVAQTVAESIQSIARELATGRPLQYVLGETIFYDCRLIVNENVLIPRQETEELVDLVLKENKNYNGSIIDFCTGSGCIAISLAHNLPYSKVQATDISETALSVAGRNAELNGVNINFLHSDLLGPVSSGLKEAGIIVSNPPYVRNSEKQFMHKNVLEFEPHEALFVPDDDPLLFYKALVKISRKLLFKNGKLYLEINEAFGKEMVSLCESSGLTRIEIIKDINGRERILKAIKNE
jgi:release factor glutamine methyltransferase